MLNKRCLFRWSRENYRCILTARDSERIRWQIYRDETTKSIKEFILAKEAWEKITFLERENKKSGPTRNQVSNWNSSLRKTGYSGFRHSHNGATGTSFKGSIYYEPTNGTLLSNEVSIRKANCSRTKCSHCNKAHWSDECDVFKTVEETKLKGSCYRCLKGHMSNDCKSTKTCVLWGSECSP